MPSTAIDLLYFLFSGEWNGHLGPRGRAGTTPSLLGERRRQEIALAGREHPSQAQLPSPNSQHDENFSRGREAAPNLPCCQRKGTSPSREGEGEEKGEGQCLTGKVNPSNKPKI